MTNYERVVRGLRANIASGIVAESMVKMHASPFANAVQEESAWNRQLELLDMSHIFEFDRETAFLMQMTDNKPHDARLPFPHVFIDASFTLEDDDPSAAIRLGGDSITHPGKMVYLGLLLEEVKVARNIRLELVDLEEPILQGHAYIATNTAFVADSFYPVSVDIRSAYAKLGYDPVHVSRFATREMKLLRNITYNFLDILEDTSNVIKIQLKRGAKNADRRKRQGKFPLPPSTRIILRPELLQRVYGESRKWSPPDYRFWVRGHWRHFHDERYKFMRGKSEWIAPFIKGRGGLLVKKKYATPQVVKEERR